MLAGVLVSVLVYGAPDTDAAKKLRVAWASQYEWKEDKVKNITLHFTYEWRWEGRSGQESTGKGEGHVVVVGDEVQRRHYPGARESMRERLDTQMDWILARFIRKPFEEQFKDVEFKGPEVSAYKALKITAGDRVFYVKDDRLFAEERAIGERKAKTRVDFDTEELRDGYAIVGETYSFTTRKAVKTLVTRTLKARPGAATPAPGSYVYTSRATGQGKEELKIEFGNADIDVENPVTLDPAARDALKAAWERRFVLPKDIRIQGDFTRKPDTALARVGWSIYKGTFQLWGMEQLEVALAENTGRGMRQAIQDRSKADIRWMFDLLRDTPFDEEFKGCGFRLEPAGKEQIVHVLGHKSATAFRIGRGAIVGREEPADGRAGWWTFKVKPMRDGRFVIDKIGRMFEEKNYELKIKYQRVKGTQVPKSFQALTFWQTGGGGGGRRGRGASPIQLIVGALEYSFKRLKVHVPKQ